MIVHVTNNILDLIHLLFFHVAILHQVDYSRESFEQSNNSFWYAKSLTMRTFLYLESTCFLDQSMIAYAGLQFKGVIVAGNLAPYLFNIS